MSPVIRRYLSLELLQYWLLITLVLWLVLVAARFSLYLGQAAGGQLPASTVLWLLAFKSVGFFVFLLPLTLFLALLWLLGRLNRDHESLALAASGVGTACLYRAVALPVLGAMLLVAALSWYLVPTTAALGYQLRSQAEHNLDMDALQPGRFHKLQKGRWLVYAQRAGPVAGSLEDVFVHISGPPRGQVLVAARAGVETGAGSERFLVLEDGYRYDGIPGQADYRVLRYRQYRLHLQTATAGREKKWDAVPTRVLWERGGRQAGAEWQRRLSYPVSVLVLALMAVPLARFRPATSPAYPLWLGVMLFALYFNLLGTGQLWLEQGRMPGWPGLWWVHGLMLLALLVFTRAWRGRLRWRSA